MTRFCSYIYGLVDKYPNSNNDIGDLESSAKYIITNVALSIWSNSQLTCSLNCGIQFLLLIFFYEYPLY